MRKIKFRAWDNVDYMSTPFTLYDIQEKKVQFTKDVLVMQYTGLKDKNGKEIYEGDILKSDTWGKGSRIKNPYNVVRWGNCGWKAEGYNGNIIVNPNLDVRLDFEIIGNIYENPELLK